MSPTHLKILHFSDLHIGIENYGRFNPETGLHTRLEDFLRSLDTVIETALAEAVDLVVLGGDAFHVNDPRPIHQKVFAERIFRLSMAGIPTFLLVGNHDQTNKYGEAHALEIFKTLNIPHIHVAGVPGTVTVQTRSGPLQIVALPHVPKSGLMTGEYRKKNLHDLDLTLVQLVDQILDAQIRQLDPEVPAILVAHAGIENARLGSEHTMSIGYGFTLPLASVAKSAFRYVALGHVHKHQILAQDPPVIYPGSLERVDFGEEHEEKGFMMVEVAPDQPTRYEFRPIAARCFATIEVDLQGVEDPHAALLRRIERAEVADKIVRLIYTIEPHRSEEIAQDALRQALKPAFFHSIRPVILDGNAHTRIPELDDSLVLNPVQALTHYLTTRADLKAVHEPLLERARLLLAEAEPGL